MRPIDPEFIKWFCVLGFTAYAGSLWAELTRSDWPWYIRLINLIWVFIVLGCTASFLI